MDYFIDALSTNLGHERGSCVAVYAGSESSRISSKYLNLCFEDERSSYGTFTRGVCVNAWRRVCLKLGADATVIVTTANHITFLVLHERDWLASALRYLHKAIWLADACIGAWKVFNFCHEQRQWSNATDPQFSSATLDVTPFKVNERRWCRRFGTTWGWVINDRIFFFGWTIPLRHRATAISMKHLIWEFSTLKSSPDPLSSQPATENFQCCPWGIKY